MKKNYIIPEISVAYVNTADCITSSQGGITHTEYDGIGYNLNDNLFNVSEW